RLESMVARANPLEELDFFGRVLRFGFRRISDGGSVQRLLGFVEDATRQVELERQIEAERERGEGQMKLLFSLLNVSPVLLADFLDQVASALGEIEARFEAERHAKDYKPLLADLLRRLHNLKGNASTLSLDAFANAAHFAEDEVEVLRARESVDGKDFLRLVRGVDEIRQLYKESRGLLERTRRMQAAFAAGALGADVIDAHATITSGVRDLIRRRSAEMNREIELDDSEFDARSIPGPFVPLVRDILIQLARNSIVHGIEEPTARARQKKPAVGRILFKTEREVSGLLIVCEDDGAGIDTSALKERAVAAGRCSAAEAGRMSAEEAAQLIFVGGVSTADRAKGKATMDAGRGVGLDLVRGRVREAGGRVDVAFAPGKFCRFTIALPIRGARGN
ncbi:MAG: ATP-binding protein, partial [Leptospirales bacterium]